MNKLPSAPTTRQSPSDEAQAKLEALDFATLSTFLQSVAQSNGQPADSAAATILAAEGAHQRDLDLGTSLLPRHLYVIQAMLCEERYGKRVDMFVHLLRCHVLAV